MRAVGKVFAASLCLPISLLVPGLCFAAKVTVGKAVFSQNISAMATQVKSKLTHNAGAIKVSEADANGSIVTSSSIAPCSDPVLTSSISGQSTGYAAGGSVSQLLYFFQVFGPKAVSVPVIVTAKGMLDGIETPSGSTVSLSVTPNVGSGQAFSYECNSSGSNVTCGAFTTPVAISVTASTRAMPAATNSVFAQTSLALALPYGNLGSDTIGAVLGLSIAIDPAFKDAKRYSIIVSKNVCNAKPSETARGSDRPDRSAS